MSEFLDDLFSLRDKVAIVTGASRGIGEAVAVGLHRAGARVLAMARSSNRPEQLPAEIAYRACNVTDVGAFGALCDDTVAREGRLDILVNAAGISIAETEEADALKRFDASIETNLRAVYAACLSVARHMRRSGGGSIVNVTSINSVLGFPGNPGYVASKGGLRMLTKALAIDFADANIRVNALVPGYIRTAMTAASYADDDLRVKRLNRMIIPRWGEPGDLVGAAIFLASSASSYITGQDLFVDGGWVAKGL